jgi:GAF domain-containing protein
MGWLISKAMGFIAPNKAVIILFLLFSGTGYLLINSYKANGKQSEAIQVLEQNNNALALAYDRRLAEFNALQEKQRVRDEQQSKIDYDLTNYRRELAGFNDETDCIDFDLGIEFSKLLDNSTSASD